MHARASRIILAVTIWAPAALTSGAALAQSQPTFAFSETEIANGFHMLSGAGGNLLVCAGDEGVLLVDAEYERLADQTLAAVRAISKGPLRYVINTHWHFDHVGGNQRLAAAGAIIIAHAKVRSRMSAEQHMTAFDRKVPAAPPAARPALTYESALTLHFNGHTIQILHPDPAHTDGDSVVFFSDANVLHAGDLWFHNMYPFIDVSAGGSIDGMIAGVDRLLTLVNDETKIVPGHGPLGETAALRDYRAMLQTVRDRVMKLIDAGQNRVEIIGAKPTADLDETWQGAMPPDLFVGTVIDSLARR